MPNRAELIHTALQYYRKKCTRILSNELSLSDAIKHDLEKNSAETIKVEDNFESFKELAAVEGIDYRQVICDALECYIQGLKEEVKDLNEKIGIVTLENTFREIEEAEKTRDEICKSLQKQFQIPKVNT